MTFHLKQKKGGQNGCDTKKQDFKKKGREKIFLHEKLKDLLPPSIWTMWI